MLSTNKNKTVCEIPTSDTKSGTVEQYLNQYHTNGTRERYQREIDVYLSSVGENNAFSATYGDVMDYIGILRKKYDNTETIKVAMHAIKKYYDWLVQSGQRKSHPCKDLKLRDGSNRDVQIQNLFKPEELELLMERRERYKELGIKNQVIISLLIYQGLTSGEIVKLTTTDINLSEGEIIIGGTTRTKGRTLKLKTKQIMLFHKYINEIRPKLSKGTIPNDTFILTKLGTAENGEGIGYLLETAKHLFPGRTLNAKTIRQSVIANLLKSGHDLRIVQTFAGHKYPSSTERYRLTGVEELKAGVQKYHPLK